MQIIGSGVNVNFCCLTLGWVGHVGRVREMWGAG